VPTHLIRSWVAELAKKLRNDDSYDDWDVAMEPIPGDKTWSKRTKQCESCSCKINKAKDKA
jgi:hypothetical protein